MHICRSELYAPLVLASSKLPNLNATAYKSMKAYGMHLQCRDIEEHMAASNNGVAAFFNRVPRMSPTDPMPMVQKEEYLWWIKEILELNYKEYYIVVLAYKWVKVKSTSRNPTIVHDIYGFTFANISDRIMVGLGPKCFAFPIHV